jgi:hypothetical protein
MTISADLREKISYTPNYEALAQDSGMVSEYYQRWFQSLQVNLNDTITRGNDGLLLNPDFNWSRVNGTTPTTQANGDGAQFVEQWAVNGATGNNYTLTPTPYAADATNNTTGSNLFVNFNISSLGAPLSVYNVNYAPDFSYAQKLQNNDLTCSLRVQNNMPENLRVRFSVEIQGIAQEIQGKLLTIQPGIKTLWTKLNIPSLKGTAAATNAYARIKLNIESIGASGTADFDIQYIKAELAGLPTRLEVNHLQQVVSIDAINSL